MIRYIIAFLLIVFYTNILKAEDRIINFAPVYVNSIMYKNNYLLAGTDNEIGRAHV